MILISLFHPERSKLWFSPILTGIVFVLAKIYKFSLARNNRVVKVFRARSLLFVTPQVLQSVSLHPGPFLQFPGEGNPLFRIYLKL